MSQDPHGESGGDAGEALELMERALALLDRSEATSSVTPHLDLAICRLCAVIGKPRSTVLMDI